MTLQIPKVIPNDWTRLRIIIDKLKYLRLGTNSSPTFAGLTLSGLTATRVLFAGTDGVISDDAGLVYASGTGTLTATILNATDEDNILQVDGTTVLRTGNIALINTFVGTDSGISTATGTGNVGMGSLTLNSLTDGNNNLGVGSQALRLNTTGDNNVAIGNAALRNNIGGDNCVAIGFAALNNSNSFNNVAIGGSSQTVTSTGRSNISIGSLSMFNNTTGTRNTVLGISAYQFGVNGDDNVMIGESSGGPGAGSSQAELNRHVCIGASSGNKLANTSSDNVFIGYKSGFNQTTNSDLLIIDNQDRGSIAAELTDCLICGVFGATPADQTLRINAQTEVHGLVIQVVAKTGAYTLTAIDDFIECDASGGAFIITLPAVASTTTGKVYHIKKTDNSANVVTVDGNASETIDGGTTARITTQYECITIINNGSEWWIL